MRESLLTTLLQHHKMLRRIATRITLQVSCCSCEVEIFYAFHHTADQNFVCLPTTDDEPGYINASFVDVS